MRYNKLILPIVAALLIFPLTAALSAAAPATQPGVQGFKILLSDGSTLKGALSFTLNITTQYGQLTLPSTDFVSADFDSTGGWAEIRTKSVALRVQYKPESSFLQTTTEVGPVNVDLAKVVSIDALYAEAPNWTPPEVSNSYDEASQGSTTLSDIYSQPATLMDLPPYEYGAEAPYYWPSYYPTEPYCYTGDYPYSWCPDFGFGFIGCAGFGQSFGFDRHHDRFDGRFDGRGSGAIWKSGVSHSDGESARQFDGTAGESHMTSGRTFSSPTFRSDSTASYSNTSAPTYRSSGTRSSYSGGTRFSGGGFSHSSGFSHSGGFGGGGFGGHGGGGHGR
ncbi:MAG: hypothetical protein ABSA67_15630 [Candidatus Brocadiia bacterium]|jgi:uncharacterized membrane protein YgcG